MNIKGLLLSGGAVLAPAVLVGAPASAQSTASLAAPNVRSPVDEQGVDLNTGGVVIPASSVSIGGANGLSHVRTRVSNGWRHNYLISLEFSTNGTDAFVNMGGSQMRFKSFGGLPTFTSQEGTGDILTKDTSAGTHTLVLSDGTEIVFKESYVANDEDYYGAADAVAETITAPNGQKTTLHYLNESYDLLGVTVYVLRLQSVTNEFGYQLRYRYAQTNAPTLATVDDWFRFTKVVAINNAVDDCDPVQLAACTFSENWPSLDFAMSTDSSGSSIETVTNNMGEETVFRFDTSDRLSGIKRPVDVAQANGYSVTYAYETSGDRVVSVSRQGSYTRTYAWTSVTDGLQATSNDTLGRTRRTVADDGNILRSRDGENNETEYEYGLFGRLTAIVAPEGNRIEYTYDGRGNVTKTEIIDKNSPTNKITTSATFPSSCANPVTCNLPTSTTDANGNVTNYTWNATHGGLVSVEAPAPNPGDPRPKMTVQYQKYRARFYNASGTLVQGDAIDLPSGTRQCRTASSCLNQADELKTSVSYTSSGAHNLNVREVSQGSGNGAIDITADYTYTALGNVATTDGPIAGTGDTTFYHYDDLGRVTGVISPDPDQSGFLPRLATRTTYNDDGQVTKTENGRVTGTSATSLAGMTVDTVFETEYDEFGRVETTSQVSTNGATRYSLMQYGYDYAGRLQCTALRMNVTSTSTSLPSACTTMTATSGNDDRISRRYYDKADRVTQVWSAFDTPLAQQSAQMSYNDNGTLAWVEDANNNRTKYTYDGFDRTIRTDFPNPNSPSATNPSDRQQYVYDDVGNIKEVRTRAGETFRFTYDKLNRLTRKDVPTRTSLASTHRRDVYYEYDLLGGLIEARFDDDDFGTSGDRVTFDLDALGRAKSTTQNMNSTGRTVSYQYDSAGRRNRITHPDGAYWTYEFDHLNRLKKIKDDGAVTLITNNYNVIGRLVSRSHDSSAPNENFWYDAAGRFNRNRIDAPGTAYDVNRRHTLNQAGEAMDERVDNQTYVWDGQPSGPAGNVDVNYDPNGLNQYDSINATTLTFDANGNLTSDGVTTYQYDTENRLVKATGNNNVDLRYDPLGRLFEIGDGSGGIERLLYDGNDLIAEFTSGGAMLDRYVHGVSGGDDALIAYPGSNASRSVAEHLFADRLGSIVASFNNAGGVKAINSYDEFGVPGGASGTANTGRFRYTGQIYIPELGQYHYKARAYSPGLGRFMQTDPIGYGDGLNMYAYVGNNATNFIDPLGLSDSCPENGDDDDCPPSSDDPRIIVQAAREADRLARRGTVETLGRGNVITGWLAFDKFGEVAEVVVWRVNRKRATPRSPAPKLRIYTHHFSDTYNLSCPADVGFQALLDIGGAPGASAFPDGINTRREILAGGNPVTQDIDRESRVLHNRTGPTHIFHDGATFLTVTPTGPNSSKLSIVGTGTHVGLGAKLVNEFGLTIFSPTINAVQRQCRYLNALR